MAIIARNYRGMFYTNPFEIIPKYSTVVDWWFSQTGQQTYNSYSMILYC